MWEEICYRAEDHEEWDKRLHAAQQYDSEHTDRLQQRLDTIRREKMVQKSTDKAINNEAYNGLKNNVGTIAMARTGDPNSATSAESMMRTPWCTS